MSVRWLVLFEDGVAGRGVGRTDGVTKLFKRAKAALVSFPGLPPLVIAGPTALWWTCEGVIGSAPSRFYWKFTPPPGVSVVFFPEGDRIGIGDSVEAIEAAFELTQSVRI